MAKLYVPTTNGEPIETYLRYESWSSSIEEAVSYALFENRLNKDGLYPELTHIATYEAPLQKPLAHDKRTLTWAEWTYLLGTMENKESLATQLSFWDGYYGEETQQGERESNAKYFIRVLRNAKSDVEVFSILEDAIYGGVSGELIKMGYDHYRTPRVAGATVSNALKVKYMGIALLSEDNLEYVESHKLADLEGEA